MYAPMLRLIDSPFAELPHWDPRLSRLPDPSAEECERVALQLMDVADLSEGAEEVSLYGVYSLFEIEMNNLMEEQGTLRTTLESLLKSLRSGIKFFPVGLKMKNLTKNVIRDAKMAMLKKLALRTARSRMNDLKRMLKWFYASEYGGSFTPTFG